MDLVSLFFNENSSNFQKLHLGKEATINVRTKKVPEVIINLL